MQWPTPSVTPDPFQFAKSTNIRGLALSLVGSDEEDRLLEALLAATATSGLLVLARGQRQVVDDVDYIRVTINDGDDDLPCPWCYSPTAVEDDRCPTCSRRFG